MKQLVNLVWLKRDLRSNDHLPLHYAEQDEIPYFIIYLFEPSLIAFPDTSIRHLQFQYHSINALNKKLQRYNRSVITFYAEAIEAFNEIQETYSVKNIFSYQESGTQITYDRDKSVASYCARNNISWKQFQRDGIIRGIKNREGWDQKWYGFMSSPITQNTFSQNVLVLVEPKRSLPEDFIKILEDYPSAFQPAGEENALRYLESFVKERAQNYSRHISKPEESRKSCTRLSPYISWGNISVKQVYQRLYEAQKQTVFKGPIKNAMTRLKWHCHFIQKFEVDCSYEDKCINSGYEMLEHPVNETYIEAWKTGRTGYPLIDACMHCLIQTGWINFRMRAMLVSFFCHHLYQDWRLATKHLANLFLDYEPGIHYPQFQMQAGTTGINTIRIYNPVKQSQDHDPNGLFIKKWISALKNVPENFIHEPHKMSLMDQQFCQVFIGKDYPMPIVDIATAGKEARKKIWSHRQNIEVKEERKRILRTHTRAGKI